MAITSIKTGSSFTNLVKYNDFLGPNPAFNPSSYESIATVNGTGSSGTITFSSIPSTYTHLQVRGMAISADTDAFHLRMNSDTGSNYAWHRIIGNGTGASATGGFNATRIDVAPGTDTFPRAIIVDIHDYASTTKNKTARVFTGIDQNTAGNVSLYSGLWMNTAAVNTLTFTLNSGNFNSTTVFSLYGIKGA
jgi:hypothetical protein